MLLRKLRRLRVTVIFYTCGTLCLILLLVNFNEDVKKLLQQSQGYTAGTAPHDHDDHDHEVIESALMSSRDIIFPVSGGGGGIGGGGIGGGGGIMVMGGKSSDVSRPLVHIPLMDYASSSSTFDRPYAPPKRLWFMSSRATQQQQPHQQPQSYSNYATNKLWPEESPNSDRIVEQLMYFLDESSYSPFNLSSSSNPAAVAAAASSSSSASSTHSSFGTPVVLDDGSLSPAQAQPFQRNFNRLNDNELTLGDQGSNSPSSNQQNNFYNISKPDQQRIRMKTILFYYGLGTSWGPHVTNGRHVFLQEKCPVNACRLTGNRAQIGKADAVVFKDVFMNPKVKRPPLQLWIMYMLECPLNTQNFVDKNMFNMTATYRHDSDIVTPYEKWVYHDDNVRGLPQAINYAAGKTKKVAWFVSNCVAKNNRLEYARELGKHIEVDIYGACGSHACSRANAKTCFDLLSKHYKFYLAFENSNCRDYVSEKFFVNGLGNSVLPIVMGAHPDDYKRVAPEKSYIHVDDFATPKELAQYLRVLDANDELYNEYFRWKGTGEFVNTHFFCRLCAMVHYADRSTHKNRYYEDMNNWWRGPNVCTRRSWRNQKDIFATDYYDKQTTNHDNA